MNPILRGAVLAMALSIAPLGADLGHAQNAPAAEPIVSQASAYSASRLTSGSA